jgi:hypothetical protein
MIYEDEWQECKRSLLGDINDCNSCKFWDAYLASNPSHYIQHGKKRPDGQSSTAHLDETHLEPLIANKSSIFGCANCGRGINRDYPAYHIHSSIISETGGVPNPPKCADCRAY